MSFHPFNRRLFQHGVIPGLSPTKAQGISSPGMRPASCGLATMESNHGILCWTGCVVEADIDLRGEPGGIGRARRISDPEAIAAFVRSNAPGVVRIGLETGPTATWLWTELKRLGLPMICIDARHAKAVLKMQINKSDRNDAAGIARIMQTGWFKEVRVKDLDSHAVRALLASRALLVKIKRDLENQVRGLLKNLGLVIGVPSSMSSPCEPRS